MHTSGPTSPAWYVIHAKPRQETEAAAQLTRQNYDVYLPTFSRWRKTKGIWTQTEEALFPRYLFARPTHPEQGIGPMRSTRGVSALVRFGHEPARLPSAIVDAIRAETQRVAELQACSRSPFAEGEAVAIVDGPLAGLNGIVARSVQERVIVLIELLGKTQRLAVPSGALSHLDA